MQKNKVVDISLYIPNKNEWIFVDTNILLIVYYAKYDKCKYIKQIDRKIQYETFLKTASQKGARLLTTRLNVTEFLHCILKVEAYDVLGIRLDNKDELAKIRNSNNGEKDSIRTTISDYMIAIEGTFEIVDVLVNKEAANECVMNSGNLVDTNDTLIVKAMCDTKHQRILTDDQDYVCIQGVTVLTANKIIIDNARKENRLI